MKPRKREQPASSEGKFLKLADGESKIGVFRGDMYEFHSKWDGRRGVPVGPDDPDGKLRFRANFVVYEKGGFKPYIFEFGIMVNNILADIADVYDLDKTKIKITRQGVKTDTVYMILPVPGDIPASSLNALANLELLPLAHEVKNAPSQEDQSWGEGEPPSFDEHSEIPF